MDPEIWLCEAPHNIEYQVPFLSCLRDDRTKFMAHLTALHPLQQANDRGEPFDPDLIPDRLFWGRKGRHRGSLPALFHNAFTYLRADVAEIVGDHALGRGGLRPIALFQNDTVTPIDQSVCALVIGNAWETLDIGASDLEVHRNDQGRFVLPLSTAGKSFRRQPGLVPTTDVWADPRVSEGFFLSGRLVRALARIATPTALGLLPVS